MASRVAIMRAVWSRFAAKPSVRGLFDAVATSVVGLIGGYSALDPRRKIIPRNLSLLRSLSANELANMGLAQLRTLTRRMERDNATARAVVEGLVAQIVGTGIALEPDHGDDTVNARLRAAWMDYIQGCDVSGRQTIYDIQQMAAREMVIAGEFLWRLVVLPERIDAGKIPLAVLPLECEWLINEPAQVGESGITAVAGIELDKWGRPVAYHLKNPEAGVPGDLERVKADDLVHGFERRRALQARGEPWLVPVLERIWQEGDLVDAELKSAVNCSALGIVIKSNAQQPLDTTEDGTTDDPAQRIALGAVARLAIGEDIEAFSHNRPAQQIDSFRQTLRGDIAAACRVSQRWLDRNYARANYSSMRADMLDSEKLLSPVREWFGHATIGALYLKALPYLCVVAGVKMPKKIAYRLLPDGQPYVDPKKDAEAALVAIAGGLSTHEAEIAKRGGDLDQVWTQKAKEKAKAEALGLVFTYPVAGVPADPESGDLAAQASDSSGAAPIEPAKKPAKKPAKGKTHA